MSITTTAVADSATTIYTSSGNTVVSYVSLTNRTASAVDVDIHVVPSGDSVSNDNLVAKTLTIDATDTYFLYTGNDKLILGNADTLSATANTASAVNSVVSHVSV